MTYLWAGYGITWLAVAWFTWRLERRAGRVARHLRAVGDGPADDRGGASPKPRESERHG